MTLRKFVSMILERFKGRDIPLDKNLDSIALLAILRYRGIMVLRSWLRGWSTMLSPRSIVFFDKNVVIRCRRKVSIGSGSTLGRDVCIDGLSRRGVTLGSNVNLGDFSIIKCTGSFSELGEGVNIGANVGIGAFSYLGAAGGIDIGENCIMGPYIGFYAESHNYENIDLLIRDQGVNRKGIRIGGNCWVGSNVTFLDGCDVGEGCVIGAGSVVTKSIPKNSVAVGIPARVIATRDR